MASAPELAKEEAPAANNNSQAGAEDWPQIELPRVSVRTQKGYSEIGVYEEHATPNGDLEAGPRAGPSGGPVQATSRPGSQDWSRVLARARKIWNGIKGIGMEDPITPEEHEAQLADCEFL